MMRDRVGGCSLSSVTVTGVVGGRDPSREEGSKKGSTVSVFQAPKVRGGLKLVCFISRFYLYTSSILGTI